MNNTSISILTSSTPFIDKIKEKSIPIMQNNSFMYTIVIPVCAELRACNFLEKFAEETKATVSMYVFYQDPGTGESRDYWMIYAEGEAFQKVKEVEDEKTRIKSLAIRRWNHGIQIPEEDKQAVLDYITSHPKTFKVRKAKEE